MNKLLVVSYVLSNSKKIKELIILVKTNFLKMFTIKKLNNHIDNFLLELKYRDYYVTKAILFGSYANGNVHENIDIDIAICANEFYENTDNTQNIASIVSKFDPIQIKLYHTFENSSPFIEVINKTGRKIQLN